MTEVRMPRPGVAPAHTHGRFQHFLCWMGAHPICCHQRIGLLQNFHRCTLCNREWAGP